MTSNMDSVFSKTLLPKGRASAAAFRHYASLPMPTTKREDWKYSDVSAFDFGKLAPLAPASLNCRIENAQITDAAVAWAPEDKLEAAISTFAAGNARIVVPKNVRGRAATSYSLKNSTAKSIVVEVGAGATLDYYEHFSSSQAVFLGLRTLFKLGEGAVLNHYSLQNLAPGSFNVQPKEYRLAAGAIVNSVHCETGASFSRVKINQHFDGDGSAARTSAVFFGASTQRFDLTTNSLHHARNTRSDILAKGCLKDTAASVYRGLIQIDKKASGTDSFLQDRVLHLPGRPVSNSIPSLVIDNNDVKASHGATVSRLDDNALFYLRSRGLPRSEASRLVVDGFLSQVTDSIADGKMKLLATSALDKKSGV